MTIQELKQIPISECEIILPEKDKDPVYSKCIKKNLLTIGDFLYSFSTKGESPCILMQLKGIFDLLAFRYFENYSQEIIYILEKHFILYINQNPITSIDLFARLGFSPREREYLTTYLLEKNKGIVSVETLISYLANFFYEIKAKQTTIPFSLQEGTVFENKIVLLINLYQKYIFSKEERKAEPIGLQQLKMEKH